MEVTIYISLRKSPRRRRSRRKERGKGLTAPRGSDETIYARPAYTFKLVGTPFLTKTIPSSALTVALKTIAIMPTFNLNNAVFYTPPRATGLEGTSQQSE